MLFFTSKISNYFRNLYTFLISNLFDIYKIGKYPSFLSIEISSICNLHCPQCPVGIYKYNTQKYKFLSIDNFELIIKQFNSRILNLILYFQGEPFLNPQFIDIIKLSKKHNIYTQTSTNAQNIDEYLAEQIVLSGLNHIIISIDGTTQKSYEKYRVGGKLESCIEAIKLINKYKKIYHSSTPKIESQMIVFKHNENEIDKFKLLSKKWGSNKYTIKSAQIYNFENNTDIIPTIIKYSRYIFKNGKWTTKQKTKNKCWRVWNGAVINTDGELLPCCYDKHNKYSYGNVFNEDIYNLWNNNKAMLFRKTIMKNKNSIDICNNCL